MRLLYISDAFSAAYAAPELHHYFSFYFIRRAAEPLFARCFIFSGIAALTRQESILSEARQLFMRYHAADYWRLLIARLLGLKRDAFDGACRAFRRRFIMLSGYFVMMPGNFRCWLR